MARKSKSGIIGIILASLVVIASLIVLTCVLKHKRHGNYGHHMDHAEHHMGNAEHHMNHDMHSAQNTELHEEGEGITVEQGYARAIGASAQSGAVFMVIKNFTDEDDRLTGAVANVANKAELHTHMMDANGVMRMRAIEGGLAVPAHSQIELKRGGDHVMMMGLKHSLNPGDIVTLFLTFEKAGEIIVKVPVDLKR